MRFLLTKSLVVSIFVGAGLATSLVADVLIAATFGLGARTDALFLSLTVPQLLAAVTNNSVDQILIPVFSSLLERQGRFSSALNFAVTWSVILVALLCVLAASLSGVWMSWLGVGSPHSVRTTALKLIPLLIGMMFFSGVNAVLGAALKAQHHFAAAAAGRALQGASVIACLVLFGYMLGIASVALGYVVGTMLHSVWLSVQLLRTGHKLRVRLKWPEGDARQLARGMTMTFGAELFRNSYVLVERGIASLLPLGSISALALASRLIRAIILLADNSLSTVALPEMSRASVQQGSTQLRLVIRRAMGLLSAVNAPVVIVLLLLRVPLANLLYQYGRMSISDVGVIASLIGLYAPLVLTTGWEQVLVLAQFALRDFRTGSRYLAAVSVAHICASVPLGLTFGVYGLAMATTLISAISSVAAWLLLRRRALVEFTDVGRMLSRIGAPALGIACVIVPVRSFVSVGVVPPSDSLARRLMELVVPMVSGCIVYVTVLVATQMPEARSLLVNAICTLRAKLSDNE